MRPALALLLPLLLAIPPPARAQQPDARVAFLTRQLRSGSDPRVRAQAALVLGRSGDGSAMAPLCEGLADGSEVVRSAAARALEQLGELEAIDCLGRARSDSSGEVKAAVAHALAELTQVRDRKPVFYISLKPVKLPAGVGPEVAELAEQRLRRHLQELGTRWAPRDESRTAAKGVLKKEGLRGFLLMPELQDAGAGGMRLRVLCMSYPEQSLLGEVDVKAAGGKPADLIRALAPRAVSEAAEIFEDSRN
jgi:hypothetical protein